MTKIPKGFEGCYVQYQPLENQYLIHLKPNPAGDHILTVHNQYVKHPTTEHEEVLAAVVRKWFNPKNPAGTRPPEWDEPSTLPESNMSTSTMTEPFAVSGRATPPNDELKRLTFKHVPEILKKFTRPISTTYVELELQDELGLAEKPEIRSWLHQLVNRHKIKRHSYDTKRGYFWANDSVPPGTSPASMKYRKTAIAGVPQKDEDDEEPENEEDQPPEKKMWTPAPEPEVERAADHKYVHGLEIRVKKLEDEVTEAESTIASHDRQLKKIDDTRRIEFTIHHPDKTKVVIKDQVHEAFEQCLFHIMQHDNVMLVGPKGCGKTTLCGQLAKAMKLDWNFMSLSGGTTEAKLYGKSTPNITNGKMEYHAPAFVMFYTNGGLFLLDEVDAADPNVLLSLNNPLDNKEMAVDRSKNPLIKMNPKFVCMAAANTWGHGADRQYVGRNQQDSAFIERFVQIGMDYDKSLEAKLCPGKEEWLTKMHTWRDKIRTNRLEREISTRIICRHYKWLKAGKDEEYCEKMLFSGWREDEIRKVKGF